MDQARRATVKFSGFFSGFSVSTFKYIEEVSKHFCRCNGRTPTKSLPILLGQSKLSSSLTAKPSSRRSFSSNFWHLGHPCDGRCSSQHANPKRNHPNNLIKTNAKLAAALSKKTFFSMFQNPQNKNLHNKPPSKPPYTQKKQNYNRLLSASPLPPPRLLRSLRRPRRWMAAIIAGTWSLISSSAEVISKARGMTVPWKGRPPW